MDLPHVALPAQMSCVMIVWVAATVVRKKRENILILNK
jgi:hypothetical protein